MSENEKLRWARLRAPACVCVTVGFCLMFVAESLLLNDPRGYTPGCQLLFSLVFMTPTAIVLALVALPAAFGHNGSRKRWFSVFAWLFLAAGVWRFGVTFYTERVLKPRLAAGIRQLIDDGKIPPPFLLAEGKPPEYTDGYCDGFQSGRSDINSRVNYAKDRARYDEMPAYRQGWHDGFLLGQAKETSVQQANRLKEATYAPSQPSVPVSQSSSRLKTMVDETLDRKQRVRQVLDASESLSRAVLIQRLQTEGISVDPNNRFSHLVKLVDLAEKDPNAAYRIVGLSPRR